jgi:hypothetical protein
LAALIMVRTVCCETYKECGSRCSICPHRKENQEAVEAYKRELANQPFGRRLRVAAEPQMAAAAAGSGCY